MPGGDLGSGQALSDYYFVFSASELPCAATMLNNAYAATLFLGTPSPLEYIRAIRFCPPLNPCAADVQAEKDQAKEGAWELFTG